MEGDPEVHGCRDEVLQVLSEVKIEKPLDLLMYHRS